MSNAPMIDKNGEVRELDAEDFAQFKPIQEAAPDLLAMWKRGRGPQKKPTKVAITLRVSPEVDEYFRSTGKGWQSRMDQVLKEFVATHP